MNKYVSKFYDGKPEKEWNRLENPYTKFEFITTLDLISKYFPKEGKVCDIGCGPGRYSIELLKQGYDVTMVDLSKELLDIAKQKITKETPVNLICADARELSMLPSDSFEAILHLGPMYHLLTQEDRLKALSELFRLLKKGGVAIVSYLNSWGVLRYGLSRFSERYEDLSFLRSMKGEVAIPETFENFTECFWSTPPKAISELLESGLEIITYIGCESFASGHKKTIEDLFRTHPKAYQNVLQMIRETCELEQFRSSAEHIHFVVKK